MASLQPQLTALLKKNLFTWNNETTKAFEELKRVVAQPPVLRLLDFTQLFTFECNASGIGVGAVIMQIGQLIAFMSKALMKRALQLSTYW